MSLEVALSKAKEINQILLQEISGLEKANVRMHPVPEEESVHLSYTMDGKRITIEIVESEPFWYTAWYPDQSYKVGETADINKIADIVNNLFRKEI